MSDEQNDYWQPLLNRKRELEEKASTQRLSKAEQAELLAEYKSLLEKLEPYLMIQIEKQMAIPSPMMYQPEGAIEPNLDAIYKRKAELDRKFFGDQ